MRRRDFFRSALGCLATPVAAALAPSVTPPTVPVPRARLPYWTIRYPNHVYETIDGKTETAQQIAKRLATAMREGATVLLPRTRDQHGQFEWDIRMLGSDQAPSNVQRG